MKDQTQAGFTLYELLTTLPEQTRNTTGLE